MFAKQNLQENLTLLKAMRHYYAKAKKIKSYVLFISIVIPVVFMVYKYLKNIENYNLNYDTTIVSIALLWAFIAFFLENKADKYTAIGAKIQEKFDLSIFDLPNNDGLVFSEISPETIHKGSEKFKGDVEKLKDWYGGLKRSPHYLKVLIAQRTNIIWGNELKEKFKLFIGCLMLLIIAISISLAFYLNLNFIDTVVFLLIPSSPLLYLTVKSYLKLKSQINNNQTINGKILSDCENITDDTVNRCRMYQDYIFTENRTKSVLIPDWFYNLFRNDMNDMIIKTNNKLLEKYSE